MVVKGFDNTDVIMVDILKDCWTSIQWCLLVVNPVHSTLHSMDYIF